MGWVTFENRKNRNPFLVWHFTDIHLRGCEKIIVAKGVSRKEFFNTILKDYRSKYGSDLEYDFVTMNNLYTRWLKA